MHIWFNCSLVTQSLNFQKREKECVYFGRDHLCRTWTPTAGEFVFLCLLHNQPDRRGPLWNYVFFLTHYQITGVWSVLRPAYYQFAFINNRIGYQFPASCTSICFEIPNLKVTSNWNWYVGDFWESPIWSYMYYFKDNFRNNYLILKPNYFLFLIYIFCLLIFFITISCLP